MFGWINDCCESLIISKFGKEKWHEIKEKAGCTVKDGGFIRHQYYTDESSVELVLAISQVIGMPIKDVLEVFGQYFMEFTRHAGYDNLLSCQGSNLRLWLSNLNSLHEHLQDTLPRGKFPEFWCKDDTEVPGCILLYYFSERGNLFVPFVVGLVKEIARYHFDLEITMDVVQTQGEEDAEYTIYRIGTVDSSQMPRLTENLNSFYSNQKLKDRKEREPKGGLHRDGDVRQAENAIPVCPFHEIQKSASGQNYLQQNAEKMWKQMRSSQETQIYQTIDKDRVPQQTSEYQSEEENPDVAQELAPREQRLATSEIFITNEKMREIFPYHVVIDQNFTIIQLGICTSKLIGSPKNLVGESIKNIFKIKRPMLADWEWTSILKFQEQSFFLETNLADKRSAKLKAHFLNLSENPRRVLVVLAPDAKNIQQLNNMNLTMSDLPLHTFQRDAIFLGEHMYSGIRSAHKLDKISRKLAYEHNLSNSLLYSMLPRDVAQTLRNGNPYEPKHHENVTLFFSDVVGFTDLCSQLPPWDIVDMLNRLYTVMDFLADRFQLYKVETVSPNNMHLFLAF
jgi:Adenylate cyclase, family 3 (some proteins contain HAMP domain)